MNVIWTECSIYGVHSQNIFLGCITFIIPASILKFERRGDEGCCLPVLLSPFGNWASGFSADHTELIYFGMIRFWLMNLLMLVFRFQISNRHKNRKNFNKWNTRVGNTRIVLAVMAA